MAQKEVFFHVGLSKTATTYLQKRVFPHFQDIEYIHRNPRFLRATEIINASSAKRFLISREYDYQFETEIKKFASHFPDAVIIIVFRRHDKWIASQYRRFFKNGHFVSFKEFIDIKEDKGLVKKYGMDYSNYIRIVEENFTRKPIVLFYEDLRADTFAFIDKLASYLKVPYKKHKISLDKKHTSYSEKQLKTLAAAAKKFPSLASPYKEAPTSLPIKLARYFILFTGKFIPDAKVTPQPLIAPEDLAEVRDYYKNDWEAVKQYARTNNPPL